MSRSSKIYACFVSIVGILLGLRCTVFYLSTTFSGPQRSDELRQFFVLWVLYIICRCFPIFIRENYAFDMSFICGMAAVLSKGPEAAAALVLLSTPFVVKRSSRKNKNLHIFSIRHRSKRLLMLRILFYHFMFPGNFINFLAVLLVYCPSRNSFYPVLC